MKKIISVLVIGFLFASCDVGNSDTSQLELLPVSSVVMPTEFAKDSVTEIPVKYIRPTTCYFFNDFYYNKIEFQRTVAIYAVNLNENLCQADNVTEIEVPLKFKPTALGTYHFKFWIGDNSAGVGQYIEFDAVVDH